MKCVQCGTDNNLRDRTYNQGRCKNCNHPFVFEPSRLLEFNFTDPFFAKAINDISANNTLYFTPKQLFYLLDRRLNTKANNAGGLIVGAIIVTFICGIFSQGILVPIVAFLFVLIGFSNSRKNQASNKFRRSNSRFLQIFGIIIVIFGILASLAFNSFILFVCCVLLGMTSFYLGYRQLNRLTDTAQLFLISQQQFQDWIERWTAINSNPKMLQTPQIESSSSTVSTEISAYSFDRVVICDNAAIAQMLIANNFHFENSCAVLSITGYPQNIFTTVLDMLRRNPELKVYTLHDASPGGIKLVHLLRTSPDWFLNTNVMIYDLGLVPRQIFSSRGIFIRNSEKSAQQARQLPEEVRRDLTPQELKWLESGNFVELESFSPERIMRVVNQGIAKSQAPDSSDSLVVIDDGGSYGGYVYTVETFG
jgi:hypothetical protein